MLTAGELVYSLIIDMGLRINVDAYVCPSNCKLITLLV